LIIYQALGGQMPLATLWAVTDAQADVKTAV